MVDTRVKNTNKHPTILLINAVDPLAIEVARSLLEQGAYVVFVDTFSEKNWRELDSHFSDQMVSFHGYDHLNFFKEDLRRLDYVFYFEYRFSKPNLGTQEFLHRSNMLDTVLELTNKYAAKFNLVDSVSLSYAQIDPQQSFDQTKPYSAVEWQRYAENMTLEYVSKANLDARVTRLGEIIGEGMDFAINSDLQKMLIDVVKNNEINLPGDGLDTEYYTHILDAAYGVIKAIFTEETKGKTYHVCYETPITNLSIAYRLQELEPAITRIDFNKNALSGGSSIKMKKIAPNLANLGWRPRIDLDQSLSEALVFIRTNNLVQENYVDATASAAGAGLLANLKGMLGRKNMQAVDNESQGGPVNRLIAERKTQDSQRLRSMSDVKSKFADTRKKRNLSLVEKVQNSLWSLLQSAGQYFKFFQQLSPQQALLGTFFIIIATLLYFNLVAPLIVLAKNTGLNWQAMQEIKTSMVKGDYVAPANKINSLADQTLQNKAALAKLGDSARLINAQSYVQPYNELNEIYAELGKAGKDINFALQPLEEIINNYNSGIRYKVDSDNYLAASSGLSYAENLAEAAHRQSYLQNGIEVAEINLARLRAATVPSFGEWADTKVKEFNNDLITSFRDYVNYAKSVSSLTYALNSAEPIGITVILLDSSQLAPLGGRPAAVALVEIDNGSISKINLQSIAAYDLSIDKLPGYVKNEIRLTDPGLNTDIHPMALINDPEFSFDISQLVIDQSADFVTNDLVITLDTSVLDYWFGTYDQAIIVNGQQLEGLDLYDALQRINDGDQIATRDSLLTQVFGQYVNYSVNNLQDVISMHHQSYQEFVVQKHINIYQKFKEGTNATSADIWLSPFVVADSRLISNQIDNVATQNVEITVADAENAVVTATLDFSGLDNLQRVGLCLPITSVNIQVAELTNTQYSINQNGNAKCVSISTIQAKNLRISWNQPLFVKNENGQYNIKVGLIKPNSLALFTSAEISLASNYSVVEVSPRGSSVDNRIEFTEDQQEDNILNIKFKE